MLFRSEKLRLEEEKIQVSKDKVGVDANLRVAEIEANLQRRGD